LKPLPFVIPAECHSDNHIIEIDFDALKWFEQASDKDILDLAKCEWGGDYPADAVAQHFERNLTKELFVYLEKYAPDDCGFECHVNEACAIGWIKSNRPELNKLDIFQQTC
jgi:hypothetical protein